MGWSRWRRAARAELRRVLGGDAPVFEVDGTIYAHAPRDTGTWFAAVDTGDGRPRVQRLVECERCERSEPERFALAVGNVASARGDASEILVPQHEVCDHCRFAEAATAPARPVVDLRATAPAPPVNGNPPDVSDVPERPATQR